MSSNNTKLIETSINASKKTNPSNLRNKYYSVSDNVVFDSPLLNDISLYIDYLKINSRYVKLEDTHKYRPDYVALKYYNDINLEYIILMINGCKTCMEFTKTNIYVPSLDVIYDVINKIKIKTIKLED